MEHKEFNLKIRIPRPTISLSKFHISTWLPTRGNVIFTLLVIGGLFWAQNVGAFQADITAASVASTGGIAYQGRLANPGGTPLTGTYTMIFRLYAAASGGAPLWTEQWTGASSVQVSDGLFNVMLGSLTPIPPTVLTSNSNLFLGITVGTDSEMTPRVQLGSVPFATQALTVPDGSITTTKIADGAITQAKLESNLQLQNKPDWDSGWVGETNATHTTTKLHNLGVYPTRCTVWFSPTNSPNGAIYPLGSCWNQPPQTAASQWQNPIGWAITSTEVSWHICACTRLFSQWSVQNAWSYWDTGYYRVMLWK